MSRSSSAILFDVLMSMEIGTKFTSADIKELVNTDPNIATGAISKGAISGFLSRAQMKQLISVETDEKPYVYKVIAHQADWHFQGPGAGGVKGREMKIHKEEIVQQELPLPEEPLQHVDADSMTGRRIKDAIKKHWVGNPFTIGEIKNWCVEDNWGFDERIIKAFILSAIRTGYMREHTAINGFYTLSKAPIENSPEVNHWIANQIGHAWKNSQFNRADIFFWCKEAGREYGHMVLDAFIDAALKKRFLVKIDGKDHLFRVNRYVGDWNTNTDTKRHTHAALANIISDRRHHMPFTKADLYDRALSLNNTYTDDDVTSFLEAAVKCEFLYERYGNYTLIDPKKRWSDIHGRSKVVAQRVYAEKELSLKEILLKAVSKIEHTALTEFTDDQLLAELLKRSQQRKLE